MKDAAFEMQRLAGYSNSFLTSAKCTKIFNRFRSFIYKKLKDYTSNCNNKYSTLTQRINIMLSNHVTFVTDHGRRQGGALAPPWNL